MEIYTVGQVTRYIKEVFEVDDFLQDVWIEGEISNLSRAASGHQYFVLKDANCKISCVMFRSYRATSNVSPENGMAVIAHGRISVYDVQGVYQLYVDMLQPEGLGLLHLRLEQLKSALEREGLFDPARKRPLPQFPRRVGVVTSLGGAVLHDIVNVIRRRYPLVEILIAPSLVQGDEAADNICAAIRMLDECGGIDVIIVARGGGSLEDLWPFNEEQVARAIFASRAPVVTGIGHETDFTIADYVADCRAPTPSVAAELVVPNRSERRGEVLDLQQRLARAALTRIRDERVALSGTVGHLRHCSPESIVDRYRQRTDELARRMSLLFRHELETLRLKLQSQQQQLETLNPLAILARGYSICWQENGSEVVRRVEQVFPADLIRVQVADGSFQVKVL